MVGELGSGKKKQIPSHDNRFDVEARSNAFDPDQMHFFDGEKQEIRWMSNRDRSFLEVASKQQVEVIAVLAIRK